MFSSARADSRYVQDLSSAGAIGKASPRSDTSQAGHEGRSLFNLQETHREKMHPSCKQKQKCRTSSPDSCQSKLAAMNESNLEAEFRATPGARRPDAGTKDHHHSAGQGGAYLPTGLEV